MKIDPETLKRVEGETKKVTKKDDKVENKK